jgi:hypothetical protein
MKELKYILRRLPSYGFRIESHFRRATTIKIYPPDKNKQMYLLHMGDAGYRPLVQFAKREWGIDLTQI